MTSNAILSPLYQASRDGFDYENITKKFDSKSSLLHVIKTTKGFVFGIYSTHNAYWCLARDEFSFLFSLVNSYNKSAKMKIIKSSMSAFYLKSTFGEIYISNRPDFKSNAAKLNYYEIPSFVNLTSSDSFLAGYPYFKAAEIEIYQLDGDNKF